MRKPKLATWRGYAGKERGLDRPQLLQPYPLEYTRHTSKGSILDIHKPSVDSNRSHHLTTTTKGTPTKNHPDEPSQVAEPIK